MEINVHLAIIYFSLENLKVMSTIEANAYEITYMGLQNLDFFIQNFNRYLRLSKLADTGNNLLVHKGHN